MTKQEIHKMLFNLLTDRCKDFSERVILQEDQAHYLAESVIEAMNYHGITDV